MAASAAATASGAWSLVQAQRDDTVARVAANIFSMAFIKGLPISDEAARSAAEAFERKAYTAAQVAATTTTGARPHSETTRAYARKLSEQVIDLIRSGNVTQDGGGASATSAGTATPEGSASSSILDLAAGSPGRDFLTRESAEAALAPLRDASLGITGVKLSTKSFGRDAAAVAAAAISAASARLTTADISDVIAGRPEDEALDVLRTLSAALARCPGLTALNLSDNALGEKGVRACGEVLAAAQGRLAFLSLQNVGCSVAACKAVSELLTAPAELRSLQLFNNMSGDEGAAAIAAVIARAPRLADFRMASSRVGPSGGAALAAALTQHAESLVRLDISDNPMTPAVAPALVALVQAAPNLKALNINDTSLGNAGAAKVALALAASPAQLEELGIALNEVNPQGARALAAALASKPTLTRLNVRENELEDAGAAALAPAVAKLPALRVLDVCGNQLRRAGAVALTRAVVTGCPDIELLALDENTISESGLEVLRGVMKGAGKESALGPLDENMEESDEEGEEEEQEEEGQGAAGVGDLAAQLGALSTAGGPGRV